MEKKSLVAHYSGKQSKEFWDRVVSLPEIYQSELFASGVLLQNMEETVLLWLSMREKSTKEEFKNRGG